LQADVQVLVLGAPLDTITLLHCAEHRARIPGKRIVRYRRLMPGPEGPRWVGFEEFDTAEPVNDRLPRDCFERIVTAYRSSGRGSVGDFGSAAATLIDGCDLVNFGVEWLERYFDSALESRHPRSRTPQAGKRD
jgi:aminoglycoside 3-N-acetyltransferase